MRLVLFFFFLFNKHLQRAYQSSKVKTGMVKLSMADFASAFSKSLVFTPTKESLNESKWVSDLPKKVSGCMHL